jgi:hypothetical protein
MIVGWAMILIRATSFNLTGRIHAYVANLNAR